MSVVHVPREGRSLSGFVVPRNRVDGRGPGLAVVLHGEAARDRSLASSIRRAASKGGAQALGRIEGDDRVVLGFTMPRDPGAVYVYGGMDRLAVRTVRNGIDLRDEGAILERFAYAARDLPGAGEAVFAPETLGPNLWGSVVTRRMFGRTFVDREGRTHASWERHRDGQRKDHGARAPMFLRAETQEDWRVLARTLVARLDRDREPRIPARDLRALLEDAPVRAEAAVAADHFRELIEEEVAGAVTRGAARGRGAAERLSAGFPPHEGRSGRRLAWSQFSSPPLVGQLAAEFLRPGGAEGGRVVLEPTIGNGVLAAATARVGGLVVGMDLDPERVGRARRAGVGGLLSVGDALEPEAYPSNPADPDGLFDAALVNPPFSRFADDDGAEEGRERRVVMTSLGQVPYTATSHETLIAARAIDRVRPGGAAVLVMPADMIDPGRIEGGRVRFQNLLAMSFERVRSVAMEAQLFRPMGANAPVVLHFAEGKRDVGSVPSLAELRALRPARFEEAGTFGELAQRVDAILSESEVAPVPDDEAARNRVAYEAAVADLGARSAPASAPPPVTSPGVPVAPAIRPGPSEPGAPDSGEDAVRAARRPRPRNPAAGGSEGRDQDRDAASRRGPSPVGGGEAEREPDVPPVDAPGPAPMPEPRLVYTTPYVDDVDEDPFTVPYQPASAKAGAQAVIERTLEAPTAAALRAVMNARGDVDGYVARSLGVDREFLLSEDGPLSPEQIDATALALHQMDHGRAIVNGDLMGVGKGRFLAALMVSAWRQDRAVLAMTNKPHLFRDLFARDVGDVMGRSFEDLTRSGAVRPFVVNRTPDAAITTPDGQTLLFRTPAEAAEVFARLGKLPRGVNQVGSTYSQFQVASGLSKLGALKDWVVSEAEAGRPPLLLLDEVHVAAGPDSRTGSAMRGLVDVAEANGAGIVYASATSIKSGRHIGVYLPAMPETGLSHEQMEDALKRNPLAMQEVLAAEMARFGTLVQRKMSSAGVDRDTVLLADLDVETAGRARAMTEEFARFLREMVAKGEEIREGAERQFEAGAAGRLGAQTGGDQLKVEATSPASMFDNIAQYHLSAVKARSLRELLADPLARGEKVGVLTALTGDQVARWVLGEREGVLPMNPTDAERERHGPRAMRALGLTPEVPQHPHLGHVLMRASEAMLRARGLDGLGEQTRFRVRGFDGWLDDFRDRVERADFSEWRINTLDVVQEASDFYGLRFEDLTMRSISFTQEGGRIVAREREPVNKNAAVFRFNHGTADILGLNSAAATGLSAQSAPSIAVDLRRRAMVELSFLRDITEHRQVEGRFDRKGQVVEPRYIVPNTGFAGDDRMASLFNRHNRNLTSSTSGSRESGHTIDDAVDLLNPVGDIAVASVLRANPGLSQQMGFEVKGSIRDLGRRFLGRVMVLGHEHASAVMNEVDTAFHVTMERLDREGQNPLRFKRLDWRAEVEVVETLEPGDPDAPMLADRPLQLVGLRYEERLDVPKAQSVVERVHDYLHARSEPFERMDRAFDVGSAIPGGRPDWRHPLFGEAVGRRKAGMQGFVWPKPLPREVADAAWSAYEAAEADLRGRAAIPDDELLDFDERSAVRRAAAKSFREVYYMRDADGRPDIVAAQSHGPVAAFVTGAKVGGEPAFAEHDASRGLRVMAERVDQARELAQHAALIEPGRMLAVDARALSPRQQGHFGEVYQHLGLLDGQEPVFVPALVTSASYDSDAPFTPSSQRVSLYVPGSEHVESVTVSELRSAMSWRRSGGRVADLLDAPDDVGRPQKLGAPLRPLDAFVEPVLRQSRLSDVARADLLAVRLFGGGAERVIEAMRVHEAEGLRARTEAAQGRLDSSGREVALSGRDVVARPGRTVEPIGLELFASMATGVPQGSVTRTRYALTGNLFTAAVSVASGKRSRIGEKVVFTDRDGTNHNAFLLSGKDQDRVLKKVREQVAARSIVLPVIEGDRGRLLALVELQSALRLAAKGPPFGEASLALPPDVARRADAAIRVLHGEGRAEPHGMLGTGGDVERFLERVMAHLPEKVSTLPPSILVGGDPWKRFAMERKAEAQGEFPSYFLATRQARTGDEVPMTRVGESRHNASLATALSKVSSGEVAVLLDDARHATVVFSKKHPRVVSAEDGALATLRDRSSEMAAYAGWNGKLKGGRLAARFDLRDGQERGALADVLAAFSDGWRRSVALGGYAKETAAAVRAELDAVEHARRRAVARTSLAGLGRGTSEREGSGPNHDRLAEAVVAVPRPPSPVDGDVPGADGPRP